MKSVLSTHVTCTVCSHASPESEFMPLGRFGICPVCAAVVPMPRMDKDSRWWLGNRGAPRRAALVAGTKDPCPRESRTSGIRR